MSHHEYEEEKNLNGVAIIGMAGRFPKAEDIYEYWQNLAAGKNCITFYTNEELLAAGIAPGVLENPDYVKAKGEVADVDMFDASFFGINPREAEVTDPQHRMLLECAWEALEHAGCAPDKYDGSIGVYAGKSMDYYLLLNVYPYIRKEISAGSLQAAIGNDKDSLTTTISYHLNLRGPAITIQTSSSTSLVAVCVACQSILTYQCDIALAGGITAGPPIKSGYLYQEGNIWSPDGHCRAFDAKAQGFVAGSGMGMVVLKRLEDAVRDGDTIWAVIKGFAVNNDGSQKVSYSAPSVGAQAEVVSMAQAMADVHPETIQYIEAHGTGTNLGDPIEISALTRAFRTQTDKKQFCAIGSVKTNIGHLDNAAGVAGLIKTALALNYKKIPASLHFVNANPKIDFANSPFFVNTALKEWPENIDGLPRRAGVTSLGMGGTNAHVILEEAPAIDTASIYREWQLLLISAKTASALEARTRDLVKFMRKPGQENINLADAAYTLALGRKDFNRRRFVLCRQLTDACASLENLTPGRAADAVCEMDNRPVVFMFSGQGAQYVNMGKELYEKEPVFKENIDKCAAILTPLLNMDVRILLYPEQAEDIEKNMESLQQTWLTQPVLVMLEYSLAQLWLDWGIKPAAMIGHSIGEFTAACLSGCMTLEDTLKLVVKRGQLMHRQEKGAMLSVGITENEIPGILAEFTGELSLAAVNSPHHCVVSGKPGALEKLEKQLREKNIFCKRLHTSHAFHSPMMEPIMDDFAAETGKIKLNPPVIPFISCVTGTWINAEEAQNPRYWAGQLRAPVRFSNGIGELLKEPSRLFLEVGPGNSLCLLAKEHIQEKPGVMILPSIRHIKQTEPDQAFLLKTLGNLWLAGAPVDWKNYYSRETRCRIPLPTYPFERKRYWLEGKKVVSEDLAWEEKNVESESDGTPGTEIEKNEGKINKTFQPRPLLNNEYVAPTSDNQRRIAAIWEDILGIQPIGIEDNFFDLGGHSLLAALFLSRLQEELGVRLELKSIFESPTIATIAGVLEAEKEKGKDKEVKDINALLDEIEGIRETTTEISPVEPSQYYETSSAQRRMFLLNRIKGIHTISDTIPFVLQIEGQLDIQCLENIFKLIIARHEVLRTAFKIIGNTIVQEVYPEIDFKIDFIEAGSDEKANEIINKFIRPFDLGQAPLFKVQIVKLAAERYLLMYNLHHIITDGTSMGILRRDFLYLLDNRELPALKIQYKDFAAWQNKFLKSLLVKKQEEYWLSVFPIGQEVPDSSLPLDFPRPDVQAKEGDRFEFRLTAKHNDEIKKMAAHNGATWHMIFLTVYSILLSKYNGIEDVIVGVPAQNRRHPDLENMMGFFANTIAIRSFPSSRKTFKEFLGELKMICLKAYENQDYPFEELVGRLGLKPDPGRNPLFTTMLADVRTHEHEYHDINPHMNIGGYKETIIQSDKTGGNRLIFKPYPFKAPVIQFDLLIYPIAGKDNGIEFQVMYSTQIFKRETIENFGKHFVNIVENITANPGIKISEIEIVSYKKEELLLHAEQEKLDELKVDFNLT